MPAPEKRMVLRMSRGDRTSMKRRHALAAFFLLPLASAAEVSGRVRRVGLVWNSPPQEEIDKGTATALRKIAGGLRGRGWIEGRNLQLISRTAEGRYDRLPGLVEELLKLNVDVLVVHSDKAARAALGQTRTVPVVYPISYGLGSTASDLAKSLGQHGGNLTGMSYSVGGQVGKRLSLLKELAPRASRIAMLAQVLPGQKQPELPAAFVERMRAAGMELFAIYYTGPQHIEDAFAQAEKGGANAAYISGTPHLTWGDHPAQVHALAARYKLPAVYEDPDLARSGGLLGYGPEDDEGSRRAVDYIDRLLRGAKPADLPIEQPTRFYLNINRKAAKNLGLEIPPSLRIQADNIFE